MVSNTVERDPGGDTNVAESLPPLKPGRQVGWTFKNGEVAAIERHECEFRTTEDVR